MKKPLKCGTLRGSKNSAAVPKKANKINVRRFVRWLLAAVCGGAVKPLNLLLRRSAAVCVGGPPIPPIRVRTLWGGTYP
jgi:hypothetical protein